MKLSEPKLATTAINREFSEIDTLVAKRNLFSRTKYLFIKFRNKLIKKDTIVEFISGLFIILFIYTGLNKMMDHNTFISQLRKSPFMQWGPEAVSYAIPISELLLALGLIIKKTRMLALLGSFLLMAMFTGYIWIMLTYANDLPCSCGGIIGAMSWGTHLIFNLAFTLLAVIAIFIERHLKKVNNSPSTKLVKPMR